MPRTTITQLAPGVIDRRFAEVGRIRLGEGTWTTKKNQKGEDYRAVTPRKLTKPKLTSPHPDLLARAADVYGGKVTPWDDAPTGKGTQHQLHIEADALDVLVPPGQVVTQGFELWSGGGCTRRCNGLATETGEPCVCPADPDERNALAQQGKACRLTTRLSVWLPKLPGIGTWRMESHGWNAGVELPGVAEILSAASEMGRPIAATLRIGSRKGIRDGQVRQYIVPVLDPAEPLTTVLAIARGVEPRALGSSSATALEPPKPPAIGTGSAAVVDLEKAAAQTATNGPVVPTVWVTKHREKLAKENVDVDAERGLVAYAIGQRIPLDAVPRAQAAAVDTAVKEFLDDQLELEESAEGTTFRKRAA